MEIVIANDAASAALSMLVQPAEIRDAKGNILGRFTPSEQQNDRIYAEAAKHFDPEELKRRKESFDGGRTTQEILEDLKKLKPI
jgi:hypothetical protein